MTLRILRQQVIEVVGSKKKKKKVLRIISATSGARLKAQAKYGQKNDVRGAHSGVDE